MDLALPMVSQQLHRLKAPWGFDALECQSPDRLGVQIDDLNPMAVGVGDVKAVARDAQATGLIKERVAQPAARFAGESETIPLTRDPGP